MTVRSTSNNRETILGGIRSSIGVAADAADRRVAIQKRLYDHEAHIIPERAQRSRDSLLAQFQEKLEGQSATVRHVAAANDIPTLLADYLREHNLPARVRHGLDDRLEAIDWSAAPQVDRLAGPAHPEDAAGLSHAFAGASETGTLFLVSGEANPTTVNFLPETHIVVVRASDV
ncbi:MAG: LUD domain-containing protein, partial [Hyphomicrobiaceae bacterium]